jgi:DNA polymerase, archaea type
MALSASRNTLTGYYQDRPLAFKTFQKKYLSLNPHLRVKYLLGVEFCSICNELKKDVKNIDDRLTKPCNCYTPDDKGYVRGMSSTSASSQGQQQPKDQGEDAVMSTYAAFDLEYDKDPDDTGRRKIQSFAIIDNQGNEYARHFLEFEDKNLAEKQLLEEFIDILKRYEITYGYSSTSIENAHKNQGFDSDLKVVFDACNYYKIPNIVKVEGNIPYISMGENRDRDRVEIHIDLYKLYSNPTIRAIYKGKYDNCKLDTVSKALLGRGKYHGYKGTEIVSSNTDISLSERLEYVKEDARLTLELMQHEDCEIIKLMLAISEIVNLNFKTTCYSQMVRWWESGIDSHMKETGDRRLTVVDKIEDGNGNNKKTKKYYEGGIVLTPEKVPKFYNQPVYVLDVKSMYPTMIINHNISPDTVNCTCCINDENAKVDFEIMDFVNKNIPDTEKRLRYWICVKRKGILPILLEKFRELRFKYQLEGNEIMQRAVKILINGAYGVFGSSSFKYFNLGVAELTTAFGRYTFTQLKNFAQSEPYNFEVIYGDTDSIFITGLNLVKDRIENFREN